MKIGKGTLLIALFLVQTIACFSISNVSGVTAPTQTWSPFGPRSDALLFRIITSYEARIAAFEADEIDAVAVRPDDLERIRKNRPDAVFMETQAWGVRSLFFNMRNWPLSDVRVRKAIAHLIDREGYIMPEIRKGYGLPVHTIIMPTLGSWFNPNVKTYEYSIDKANKYLDDAGFKWDAQHKWRLDPKTNQTLRPIGIMTGTEAASPDDFATAIYFAKQCEKVGIKIQHEAVESAAVRTRRVRDTLEFDIYHWGWTGIGPESDWPYRFFHSKFDCAKEPGSWNRYGVNDPALDKVLEGYVETPDRSKAREYLFKAQEILQEILPWVPVISGSTITAISGKLKGLVYNNVPGLTYPVGRGWISDLNEYTVALPFGATIRRAYVDIYTINPMTYAWADEGDVLAKIYEPFVNSDPADASDSTKDKPRLLQSYKTEIVEVSPAVKATKVTLNLAKNITWHDGVPVTTKDVDFCIWTLGKKLKLYRYVDKWILDTFKTEIVNDYTMNVYVNGTSWMTWLDLLGLRVLPKHLWENIKDLKASVPPRERHPTNPTLTMLTGSGPFIMRELVAGNYVLGAWNPSYYMIHPESKNYKRTISRKVLAVNGLDFSKKTIPASLYSDDPFTAEIEIKDMKTGKTVTNATISASIFKEGRSVRAVNGTHISDGTYRISAPALDSGSYEVVFSTESKLKTGSISRMESFEFTVIPAWQKYAPYLGVITVVVAVAALVYVKKMKSKK